MNSQSRKEFSGKFNLLTNAMGEQCVEYNDGQRGLLIMQWSNNHGWVKQVHDLLCARATSELSEDDEKSEILANFFKESIAIIDKARKEVREKYPKMFEDESQADKPISIPHGPYPKPKFYPPVYDKFDYDRVALLERADKYLKTLIDDGFEDGTTYRLIKDLITPSQ